MSSNEVEIPGPGVVAEFTIHNVTSLALCPATMFGKTLRTHPPDRLQHLKDLRKGLS